MNQPDGANSGDPERAPAAAVPRGRRPRGASGGSTHSAATDDAPAGGWVLLQTSVRPSVRDLARSVCNGVTRAVGQRYTLRQFLTEAIEHHAARLASRYNQGRPWPTDTRPLPPGRSFGDTGASSGSS